MKSLRITIGQINPTIGDIQGNIALMLAAARKAVAEGASLIVFPELSLTGYYPGDLLDDAGFLRRIETGIEQIKQATLSTRGLYWVVGTPTRRNGPGKQLQNSLLVIRDGEIVLSYAKQLLPTYNVFDERRHFEPGPDTCRAMQIGGVHIGFLICEDGWNPNGNDYERNPFQRLADAAPDLVISINASPSNIGKRLERHALFALASKKHRLPLLYVNQYGGHDQLVYDGGSFAVTPEKGVVFEAERFAEDITTLRFEDGSFRESFGPLCRPIEPQGLPRMEFYRRQIVLGLRDYARRCGFSRAVVGCSGGIDSAVTLALAAEALGPENITAITMPSVFSSEGSVTDSEALCSALSVRLLRFPIQEVVDSFSAGFANTTGEGMEGLTLENTQARVRGTFLMAYSNRFGDLLLTTGNKSEISVGYCTLYGDTNGGLGLIGDLYKTEVFDLARYLNRDAGRTRIPAKIIEKAPSAELAPGQRDIDSLPSYEILDVILKELIEGDRLANDERGEVGQAYSCLAKTEGGAALIKRIKQLINRNEYKRRQAPPILRLRGRAFGSGRQMPIAAKFE
jgi:NAD+ synthetase